MSNSSDLRSIQLHAQQAITCYSLPYGGIGFGSHVITCYTMAMLYFGRKPLMPWRRVRHKNWTVCLSIASILSTSFLTCLSIYKCLLQQWQFMVLGIWMLTTNLTISVLIMVSPMFSMLKKAKKMKKRQEAENIIRAQYQFHVGSMQYFNEASEIKQPYQYRCAVHSVAPSQRQDYPRLISEAEIRSKSSLSFGVTLVLGTLWFLGCVAGVEAVVQISLPQFRFEAKHGIYFPLIVVSIVFGVFCFLPLWMIFSRCNKFCTYFCLPGQFKDAVKWTPVIICVFALLWMDWTLGIITGNLAGIPNKNVETLYWAYIASKRLGLLAL
jgi:hypothetical protein